MIDYKHISYDWKEGGCEEEWIEAIEHFGLHVTSDPVMDGTDMYGYFITKVALDVHKLLDVLTDNYGVEMIDDCFTVQQLEEFLTKQVK